MATEQPTAGDSGASSADPVERLQAYLDASDTDSTGPAAEPAQADDDDEPKDASEPTDKPEDDDQAKDTEPQITTAQLAAFLGVEESEIDVDEDGKPVFKTKIDGKESTAKFADLRKTYQLQGHAENQVREAAEAKKAADARLQEANQAVQARYQEINQSLAQVHQLAAVAQEELKGEYQQIDWNALWQQDPAQARALERRFEQRNARLQGVFQDLTQRQQQAAQNLQRERAQAEQAKAEADRVALVAERERMLKLIPEWKDQATADKERAAIREWTIKTGFNPQEVDNITRADLVAVLRRAWQHETLQQSRPAVENKVRTAPKLVKPGQAPVKDGGNSATLKSLKHNVRNASGGRGTDAVAAYLLASGKA